MTAWSLVTSGTSQTMKSSPRPLTSQKSRKTHSCRVKKIIFLWFNEKNKSRTWLTSGTCVTSKWRHALDINEWTKEMVFASWKKKSWALDEANGYSGCNLWMTMVWLKGNLTQQRCLKTNQKEGWLDPRSKLNEKQSTIGTHEAVVYCPMIDWKTKKKNRT